MRLDYPIYQPQGVLGYTHRRRRPHLVFIGLLLILCLIFAAVAFGAIVALPQGPADAPTATVELTATSVKQSVEQLQSAGVLRFPRIFSVMVRLRGARIAAGRYTVSPHLSVWSLARLITTTRPRPEREVKIIEGWDLRDIGSYFEREGIAQAEELHELIGFPAMDYRYADPAVPRPKDFTADFPFLKDKPEFIGLEGYLFPDTYRVYADSSVEDIIKKMFANFDRKLTPDLRAEIAAGKRSLHQIITVASIVEAEAPRPEDRPVIAGILWKRRDRGALLQVDATVNYATGKHEPRVSREDTAIDSAYNTYRYPGLPRGPIGNPGLDAIFAALRPKESPYWFFLTTKDGRAVFARTLEEHNANVVRYLQ